MTSSVLLAILAACETFAAASVLPSLRGVLVATASDRGSLDVIDRIDEWVHAVPDCIGDAYGGIELSADVAPSPGPETVLASFSQGVVVVAADGHRIASIPGFECTGSHDELVGVEIARIPFGAPVIAIVATEGGRRESTTWLERLAVDGTDHLHTLFAGEIERHDDHGIHTGDVTVIPGGLVYRHPTEGTSLWSYDAATGRYVIGPARPVPSDHDVTSTAVPSNRPARRSASAVFASASA